MTDEKEVVNSDNSATNRRERNRKIKSGYKKEIADMEFECITWMFGNSSYEAVAICEDSEEKAVLRFDSLAWFALLDRFEEKRAREIDEKGEVIMRMISEIRDSEGFLVFKDSEELKKIDARLRKKIEDKFGDDPDVSPQGELFCREVDQDEDTKQPTKVLPVN